MTSVDQDVIFYSVFQSCAEYFGSDLKPYHSEFELVRTDEISKEYARNIKRKVRVVRAAEFRKLSDRQDSFFFRQRLLNNGSLEPEL